MIKKITAFWKKKQGIVYALIYVVAAVLFGFDHYNQGKNTARLYSSGVYRQEAVTVHRFEMVDCEVIDDLTFKGNGNDARLIYNGDIDTLYMDCAFSYGLREFRAYYNTTGDYVFTEENSMIPKQYDKYLIYDFPEGTKQVKMYYQNSRMFFNELMVNSRRHTNDYNITTSDIFMLAVKPTIIYLVIDLVFTALVAVTKLFSKSKDSNQ